MKNNTEKVKEISRTFNDLFVKNFDKEYFFKEFKEIKNNRHNWFKTPSFGDWILFNRTITKSLRRLKEDNTAFKKCCDKMGNPSDIFLDVITDKSLYNVLDNVKKVFGKALKVVLFVQSPVPEDMEGVVY
ncbi:hypothetical protein LCGC14_1989990 [marine sediment metagenome]|uniref:Uncharacterized protein n=1 Tax=marine sediment metagenome TaxID=412755 RepID=A0A0F9F6M1_9ZZZZ